MVNVTERTVRRDGVTFATVVVENDASERRRVRLSLLVDGAVWPPRRSGIPESGWDGDAVTVTVAAGDRRGVGFATPSVVDGDVVDVTAVDGPSAETADESGPGSDPAPTADGVVRALGEFAPPLAATPREAPEAIAESTPEEPPESTSNGSSARGRRGESS